MESFLNQHKLHLGCIYTIKNINKFKVKLRKTPWDCYYLSEIYFQKKILIKKIITSKDFQKKKDFKKSIKITKTCYLQF